MKIKTLIAVLCLILTGCNLNKSDITGDSKDSEGDSVYGGVVLGKEGVRCLRYLGGTLTYEAYLLDEWGVGEYYKVVDDKFWDSKYQNGDWVKFKTKESRMRSGHFKVDAVKYLGDCEKK